MTWLYSKAMEAFEKDAERKKQQEQQNTVKLNYRKSK